MPAPKTAALSSRTGGASSRDQSVAGAASEPAAPTVVKTDAEWRAALPPAVYAVARRNGTETPWSSPLNDAKGGNFHCACCGALLYEGSTKFNSGTGWPSFYAAADGGKAVRYVVDSAYGMTRTEMRCRACDAHLGHVFNDGPAPTRMRHCVNGVCLTYKADTK